MKDGALVEVKSTTFAAVGVLERQHLQAALLTNPGLIGDDLLVIAEEYGDWTDAKRRLDLLCLSRAGQLVVVELKRTEDGGHIELQALRYAAMVSTLQYADVERAFRIHLKRTKQDPDEAEQRLTDWLTDVDTEETPVPVGEPRIVLVSAGFDKEITSAVLWLNRIIPSDTDMIRCVKITPYVLPGHLLLDVQQLIPLPEAAEYMVQVRQREHAAKHSASTKDYTKFTIVRSDGTSTGPLAKRQAIREMVAALHSEGVSIAQIRPVVSEIKLLAVDGILVGDELLEAFVDAYPKAKENIRRWFVEAPIADGDQTWVLSKMWGIDTADTLEQLSNLSTSTLSFTAVEHS